MHTAALILRRNPKDLSSPTDGHTESSSAQVPASRQDEVSPPDALHTLSALPSGAAAIAFAGVVTCLLFAMGLHAPAC